MQTEMTTEAKGVDVLAVLSRRANDSCNKFGADNEDMAVLKAVRELVELGEKASDHDFTFLGNTQWADMRAFRAALLRLHPEGGAK